MQKLVLKLSKIFLVIVLILSENHQPCFSQTASASIQQIKDSWQARWIGPAKLQLSDNARELDDVSWIWLKIGYNATFNDPAIDVPVGIYYFRKTISIDHIEQVKKADILVSADNYYSLFVNGYRVTMNDSWQDVQRLDIRGLLHDGDNVIAVEAKNIEVGHTSFHGYAKNPAGLIAKINLSDGNGAVRCIITDESWKVTGELFEQWNYNDYNDSEWQNAMVIEKKGLAKWEGAGKDANTWYCFRKSFDLDKVPQKAVASIAADSKYWLWINGELVVFEGALKRGPTLEDTYFDEVNLAKHLKKGENQVAILMWYWGRNGYCHKSSGQPGLLFQLDLDNDLLISDASWKMIRHPAYGMTGAPHPNYRLPEYNIHYDARNDIGDWQAALYDDSKWPDVYEFGVAPIAPWNALWKRPFPLWYDSGLIPYENDGAWNTESKDGVIAMKLPKNLAITPYLKVEAQAGHTIDLRTDNYIGGSEPNIRAEYITKEGIQEFEALSYMNGHEMHYTIPEGVKVLDLKYRETRLNTTFTGSFTCDDPFYNKLWIKARNTMNLNMRDAIQDADRERSQWWGDAVIVLGEMFYSCDTNAYGLIQKCIMNLVDWQKPDGVLYSPIPGKWEFELPLQMLASVGKYGFWRYYMYTGDAAIIKYVYPHVKKYLSLWEIGIDGLVIHRSGGWDWGDWGDNKDRPLMDNAWYAMALEAAIEMAKISGEPQDINAYQKNLASIKANYDERLWTGSAYRSPGYKEKTDDRGHGLAVVAGVSNPELWPDIKEVLSKEYHASPYIEKYVLESFFIRHDATEGLARMKKRYETEVNIDWCTTLWEGWGVGQDGYGGGSYNHGWAGGPLILLSEYVGGVAPDKQGYEQYHVLPQLGHLRQVEVVVPTPKGNITVSHHLSDKDFTTTLESPEASTAIVGIPKLSSKIVQIEANGKVVWNYRNSTKIDGFSFLEEDEYYLRFKVAPGKWIIKASF